MDDNKLLNIIKIFWYKEERDVNKAINFDLSPEELRKMQEIIREEKKYNFDKFKKLRTIQTAENNLYIPEKWER